MKGVIRAKGFFWIATQPSISILISIAGKNSNFEKAGIWWSAISSDKRPDETNKEFYDWLLDIWDETYGDRRTELVFIGQRFEKEKLLKELQNALLTEIEIQDPQKWSEMSDPFPPWEKIQEVTEQFEFSLRHLNSKGEDNEKKLSQILLNYKKLHKH